MTTKDTYVNFKGIVGSDKIERYVEIGLKI
jgi:hypothetical protein